MKKNDIDIYTDKIMSFVFKWINTLTFVSSHKDYKISEKDLRRLRRKLYRVIKEVSKNNKLFMLTDDFCCYVSYICFRSFDYQNQLLKLLLELYRADDDGLINIRKQYMLFLISDCDFSQFKFNKEDSFIDLMSAFDHHAYTIAGIYRKIASCDQTLIHYEFYILQELAIYTYGYCFINNSLDKYEGMINFFFEDYRKTIANFVNNGCYNEKGEIIFFEREIDLLVSIYIDDYLNTYFK